MNFKFAALPGAVALTLVLAACGGDAAPPAVASASTPTASSAPAASAEPVAASVPVAAASAAAAPSQAPASSQPALALVDQDALQRAAQEAAGRAAAAASDLAAGASSEPVLVAQVDPASSAPPAAQASSEPPPAAASSEPPVLSPSGTAGVPAAGSPQQNWLKICDPLENGQNACIMRQVVMSQNNQFLGSFLLRDDPGQESRLLAVAAVPLGVLLPFGLTWQIDGGKPVRVPYMLCDPQSCAAQLVINEAYVNSLKRGGVLKLTAKNRRNEDLTITINLAGFTAVYDGAASLTFDEFARNASGEAALEKILQDRAEAARQRLSGETSSEPPPAQ
jgi:invasion protein IalB